MKKGFVRKLGLASMFAMFLVSQTVLGQSPWSVKLIGSGKYEVDITPPKIMGEVTINVSLYNAKNELVTQQLPFTNAKIKYLQPGRTYCKIYSCDNSIKKVIGTSIEFMPEGGGGKADKPAMSIVEKSNSDIRTSDKVYIDEDVGTSDALKSGGVYELRNMDSGYLLHGDNIPSGGNVRQYQRMDAPCQRWRLNARSDGTYSLMNMDSGLMLHGDNIPSGGNVRQYQELDAPCQRWKIIRNTDGTYSLKNMDSGYVLHGDNIPSGGNVRQYEQLDAKCQRWQFTRVK